jgi:hypothetical protein
MRTDELSEGTYMIAPLGTRSRGLTRLAAVLFVFGVFWALAVAPATAAETTPTVIQQLQRGPFLSFTCGDCHATISDNLRPNHIFSHGAHMTYDCTACHPRFPHDPTGTERPKMASCFACHGLRHGPQGIIAPADCTKCHTLPRAQLIPLDHVTGYAGKPHVIPGQTQFRTSCMMCHTKAQCDACHAASKPVVSWDTTLSPTYDPGNACLACHKSDLPRLAAPVTASALDSSAHRSLGCTQCHPDFRYDGGTNATKLWSANAGLACGAVGCHPKENAQWAASIHATTSSSGVPAASCGGCHGGHNIERLKTQAAKDRLHLAGQQVCVGTCHTHQAAYASYSDYYHGAAYKQGAIDAPACWTCHGGHSVLALKDPKSMTSPEKLPSTCGQVGCHGGSTELFVESGRKMIHGLVAAKADNPLAAFRASIFPTSK